MASEGARGAVSFGERREKYMELTTASTPWKLDWGMIIILLVILQFLLSAVLDR
jgi:hypothetical protein